MREWCIGLCTKDELESPGSTRDVADEKTGRRAAATSPAVPIPAMLPAAPTPITPHPFFIVHTPPSPQGRRAPAPLPPDWRTITPAPSHPPHKKTNTKPTTNTVSSVSLSLSVSSVRQTRILHAIQQRKKTHTRRRRQQELQQRRAFTNPRIDEEKKTRR